MVRYFSKYNFKFNRTSIGFIVQHLGHVHEFVNSIDFLNISLLCLDEGVTTFFLVQAYSLAVRTVNLRCVFPLRPLDTFLWQR